MDVIIIGAGAAGLMAAKQLAQCGQKVLVLEARNRLGGRIHTIQNSGSNITLEGGAEFIHGNLKLTLQTLKEAGIEYEEMEGEFLHVNTSNAKNEWTEEYGFGKYENLFLSRLKDLKDNISIAQFLDCEFGSEKYAELIKSVLAYVEGYYAGDPKRTSALAFLEEWQNEDYQQYRVKGGYGKLMQYLADECEKYGGTINLSTVVKEIRWSKNHVEVLDELNNLYTANKAIITVPLGIWTAPKESKGAIAFSPGLPQKVLAAKQCGFGAAIKILLHFKNIFWEEASVKDQTNRDLKNLSFLISDAPIPTWWTQLPSRIPLLTGWLAGPKAEELKDAADETVLQMAFESLHTLFKIPVEDMRQNLVSSHINNWAAEPFTRGAYAYSTTETLEARKILMAPVEDTLFFAGDGCYEGPEMGTVESALISGKRAAEEAMSKKK